MEYRFDESGREYFYFDGRIYYRDGVAYLGYTNSSMRMSLQGEAVKLSLVTGLNEDINDPSVRLYIDGNYLTDFILSGEGHEVFREMYEAADSDADLGSIDAKIIYRDEYKNTTGGAVTEDPLKIDGAGQRAYDICISGFDPDRTYDVKVVKQTEAAMSYIGVESVEIKNGELTKLNIQDDRVKAEFIGDSITCGYGIHSPLPEDNYTLWDEDGEASYAGVIAKELDLNARWISASGYGMYVNYENVEEENVPKLYPYVNWFLDKELKIDPTEFEPEVIFINLGTNDSGHLDKPGVLDTFKDRYVEFVKLLKKYHPDAKIVCLIGTLCGFVYPYIEEVIGRLKSEGYTDIYGFETPYHDVEHDGVADGHPTAITHAKDAKRIIEFLKTQGIVEG